jgi:hypothetical protein
MDLRDNYGNSNNNRRTSHGNKMFHGSSSKTNDGNNRRRHRPRQRNGRTCPQDDKSAKWDGRRRNSPDLQQANSSSARTEGHRRAVQTRMTRSRTGESRLTSVKTRHVSDLAK